MDFLHPAHPGRRVRLAYCLNVHPADDLDGVVEGLERVTAPLAARLATGRPFGVGMYLPAAVAHELDGDERARRRLAGALDDHGLVPFTFNAFPYGGFHRAGLKAGVFRPRWDEPQRVEFTAAVARVAVALAGEDGGHLSISTHAGLHSSEPGAADAVDRCAPGFARAVAELARLEEHHGRRIVLGVEPEPRSCANDTGQWGSTAERERAAIAACAVGDSGLVDRHLGLCLDACHAAVEFEPLEATAARARDAGRPLAKLQFSSALRLAAPGADARGRAALAALDEPTFLHQVTALGADGSLLRAADLPELAQCAEQPQWRTAREWRCHFHVPVDLEGPLAAAGGLATTVADADALAARLLADPGLWGLDDLHLEIETYTWSVLPAPTRGAGDLIDGLEREYAHVLAVLDRAGWQRA